jgi:beta-glucanase (GH16 family)
LLFLKLRNTDQKKSIMSFKLFIASTFGLIKSTAKLETAHEALHADYQMFLAFEKSAELKEYNELDKLVKSPAFFQNKKEIQHSVFKGSKEAAELAEYKKLSKNRRLQKFYATLNSEELKRFDRISGSETMKKYKELKTGVEKHSLAALKDMDKQSKEFALYTEFEKLKDSDDLVFFRNFRKSAAYKNYELMLNSANHQRHEELMKITGSDKFKARVAYLEDNHKWEKAEEHAKEVRYAELKKSPQLVNYLKYNSSNAFDFFRNWELVFEDRFKSGKLDTTNWTTQTHSASQTLGRNFSQLGDLQAFTEGRNVSVELNTMKIEVRKEKTRGMQWQIPFGFMEQEFDYSSGVVSTAGTEWWKHGILEAKVKYAPSAHLIDAIYLLGEQNSPQINLIEMGVKNRVGLLTKSSDGIQAECESISGLKVGEFYIFRLEWNAQSLVWKINEREILTLSNSVPAFKMHLNAASIVVSEPTELPHRFEIDWVRFYQHKQKV